MLGQLDLDQCPQAHVVLKDSGAQEIAAILNYENTAQGEVKARNMMVIRKDGQNKQIPTVSRLWEPLAYPLFFPHGTSGWGIPDDELETEEPTDAPTTQMWYYRLRIL
jgi:hypothetical protein